MNKAFMKEPEQETRVFCPRCGNPAVEVSAAVLDRHISPPARSRLKDRGWYCGVSSCDVAYFIEHGSVVLISDLAHPVFPYDATASMCSCFPFFWEDLEDDVQDKIPARIRALYQKSQSEAARCSELAPDGQCCLKEIQKHYFRLKSSNN